MLPSDATPPTAIVTENVRLSKHTSVRVGGPARYFSTPTHAREVIETLAWAKRSMLDVLPLGCGTNVLVRDRGVDGVVVSLKNIHGVEPHGERWTVTAGESLSRVAQDACEQGLSGLEWACGIPGTIGGAVVMNSGAAGGCMADVVERVTCALPNGPTTIPAATMAYAYRRSALLDGTIDGVVTEVELRLVRSTPERATAKARSVLSLRTERIPVGASFGSAFRNPPDGSAAGRLLDRAGCKGLREGDAVVSTQHANFIINEAAATSAQIIRLLERMKARVRDRFDIELQEEVVIV